MISPETIATIRDRTDIAALILESVPSLKKRGRNWLGLCPFHKEKTPSFNVNQDRGFFKCFGCGESGDAITFTQKEYGYTFSEAVRYLAERAGIVIEEDVRERTEVDRARKQKDDLYSVNALAATFFEEQLRKHPLRSFALDELARRGITPGAGGTVDEALAAFRVGYAPFEWDGLADFLRRQGVSPIAAESVGLLAPRTSGSGHYDRFRHRLMFAVMDTQGRVVAFSGRALADPPNAEVRPGAEKPAKYVNSKESPVYTKGSALFGLFQARQAIREAESAVVVEGNFDVFSLHARGMSNVVAPLGTAFTADQAKLLARYAQKVVLLFDGDAAGRKATRKSREPCMEAGLVARAAVLPDGEDPDDFARKQGVTALGTVLKESKGLLVFLIDQELDEAMVGADLHEKLARVEAIANLIASEDDPLVRLEASTYADSVVAGRLNILGADSLRALHHKLRTGVRPVVRPSRPPMPFREPREGGGEEHGGNASPSQVPPSYGPHSLGFDAPRDPVREHTPRPVRRASPNRTAAGTPKSAASALRRDMVAALLDYPALLDDSEVLEACSHLEGPAALTVAALRKAYTGQKRLDTPAFLAQIPPAIQGFAEGRLAAPVHESVGEAKETLLACAERLERLILAEDVSHLSRDLEKDADLEKLRDAQQRAERRALGNPRTTGINSRLGATPHEERPVEEARNEDVPAAREHGERVELGDLGTEWRGQANEGVSYPPSWDEERSFDEGERAGAGDGADGERGPYEREAGEDDE